MTNRIHFFITVNVSRDMIPGLMHQIADHIEIFEHNMITPFPHYKPEVIHQVTPGNNLRDTIEFVWAVNRDDFAGPFHEAEDFIRHIENTAISTMRGYKPEMTVEIMQ